MATKLEAIIHTLVEQRYQSLHATLNAGNRYELVKTLASISNDALRLLPDNQSNGLAIQPYQIVDEVTGLRLPPSPRDVRFSERRKKYSGQMTLMDYLSKEWGDYTRHHLLYAEHIRVGDLSLYQAMRYHIRERLSDKTTFAAYFFDHGIMSREHLANPPKGCERQAEVLRRVRLLGRARSLIGVAQSHQRMR